MSQTLFVEVQKQAQTPTTSASNILQRKYDKPKEKCEFLQHKAPSSFSETAPPIVHEVLQSPGQPLDMETRAFMEPRFGHDFSKVKVHNDEKAGEASRSVKSLAFTTGQDIFFAPGQYAPYIYAGKHLLAHELSHVVQQTRNNKEMLSRKPDRTEPTKKEVRRDEFLRGLARRPSEALSQWRRLKAGEQTIVVTYMAAYYGLTFAQRFSDTVKRHPKPETVIHVTNLPEYTPERLQKSGYKFLGSFERIEYWVHPSGNEIWVIRSTPTETPAPPQPTTTEPPENPPRINVSVDPEAAYGRRVAERIDANVGGLHGYAIRYADGTIEFFKEGTTGPWTYRSRSGGGYDFYDEKGEKTEGLIMILDPDEIFGTAGGQNP